VTDQSSVSVVAQKLVKRGLIRSARSQADGRRIEMELTAAGQKVTARSSGAAQERLIESLKRMKPDQRRQLASLLGRLVNEAGIASATPSLFFEHEDAEGNDHSR
jgi:DNA-binding MarR family transcriptional regulator